MPNILQITPFMYADDLEEAIRFFCDLLGFQVLLRHPDYAYVQREVAGIRIMQNGPPYMGQKPIGKPFRYYLDVRDVDAIYEELREKLAALPEGNVLGPVDQGYGQRELMILAPDGGVVVFGQEIAAGSTGRSDEVT